MKLGYWSIKGRGEPSRLLLAYLKTPYTEENPKCMKDWGENIKPKKQQSGVPFINLPYLEDGKFKITESLAIPLYIAGRAKRADLYGSCFREKAAHLMLLGVLDEIFREVSDVIYGKTCYKEFSANCKTHGKFEEYSRFVGKNKYSMGDRLRFADIYLMYVVDIYTWVMEKTKQENKFLKYKNLIAVVSNVRELDGIKQYLASDKNKLPVTIPSMIKI